MKYWENCLKQIETEEQKAIDELIEKFKHRDSALEVRIGNKVINDIVCWGYTNTYKIELEKGLRIPNAEFVYLNGLKCLKITLSKVDKHKYQIFYIERIELLQ